MFVHISTLFISDQCPSKRKVFGINEMMKERKIRNGMNVNEAKKVCKDIRMWKKIVHRGRMQIKGKL